jgi:transcriptional regulator with XRE-family HTH domain
MLRIRSGLTQAILGTRAGVGRQAVSLLERGHARRLRLGVLEAILGALDARLDLRLLWNGPELDRLRDAGHAALGAVVKRRLERWGWVVRVEVSYSRYGERGRIDLLAFHPPSRSLLVVELKTVLVDVQELLGSLDAKSRLARHIAERFGWDVRSVVPAIVFVSSRTTRRRLHAVDTLFDRYALRGRRALAWLRQPSSTSGVVWFETPPSTARDVSARERVRPRRTAA